ncbi:TPA: phosphotransferase, partial [Pasteurella multocida]|nr:phosphotransferase [Pasteurella multocida]HDR1704395.1 phosphotransferase [Pasteurella multocida]
LVPCHNDLVPENILIKDNRIYFIDWEYSGMNHPLFDIAAFFLESKLLQEQQESFLKYYNNNINFNLIKNDIIAFQFTQDVLWFLWTIIKEENNEFFDGYAKARIDRAYQSMLTLQKVL